MDLGERRGGEERLSSGKGGEIAVEMLYMREEFLKTVTGQARGSKGISSIPPRHLLQTPALTSYLGILHDGW